MASIHYSRALNFLLSETVKGLRLCADSAYESAETRKDRKHRGIHCSIHKKGRRNVDPRISIGSRYEVLIPFIPHYALGQFL